METVHRNEHGQVGTKLVDNVLGDLALPGTGCAGDAK